MKLSLEGGKTLLVDGPASVNLLSGTVTVLGKTLKAGSKAVVRNGKRLPFEAKETAEFELTLGETASFLEIADKPIPTSWEGAADKVLVQEKTSCVTVVGGTDCGKTSFCIYLANRATEENRKVVIIDGDLGQSDLGPPSTIGLARIAEPVLDLYNVQTEGIAFVGATTPSKDTKGTFNAFRTLKQKDVKMDSDFLIVNTDGWIGGEEAVNFKTRVLELFAPTTVIAIQENCELNPLLEKLESSKAFVVEPPKTIRKRNCETRRTLRELAYMKYLKDARIQCCPFGWVKVKDGATETVEADLNRTINHGTQQTSAANGKAQISALDWDDKLNLVVGLEDDRGEFLGIGILQSIDPERKTMKIYTPVTQQARTIRLGQVKIDKNGKEIV